MTKKQAQNLNFTMNRLQALGFSWAECETLFKIERTLQRWGERECGDDHGCIERDETTGKPYWRNADTGRRSPVADREKGANARLAKIMANHPELVAYHQGDCRGCNLYILRREDIKAGESLDSVYTRGISVCI